MAGLATKDELQQFRQAIEKGYGVDHVLGAMWWRTSRWHISFGLHVGLAEKNVEIHLPGGFLKFGWFGWMANHHYTKERGSLLVALKSLNGTQYDTVAVRAWSAMRRLIGESTYQNRGVR